MEEIREIREMIFEIARMLKIFANHGIKDDDEPISALTGLKDRLKETEKRIEEKLKILSDKGDT